MIKKIFLIKKIILIISIFENWFGLTLTSPTNVSKQVKSNSCYFTTFPGGGGGGWGWVGGIKIKANSALLGLPVWAELGKSFKSIERFLNFMKMSWKILSCLEEPSWKVFSADSLTASLTASSTVYFAASFASSSTVNMDTQVGEKYLLSSVLAELTNPSIFDNTYFPEIFENASFSEIL